MVDAKRRNLHIVLGEERMNLLEERCDEFDITKSKACRLLIEAFITGRVTIETTRAVPSVEPQRR